MQGQLSQNQREFYLREQLKAIQKELGEGDDASRDVEELRKKLESAGMTEEVKTEALRELNRLARMSPGFAGIRDDAHLPRMDGQSAVEHLFGFAW